MNKFSIHQVVKGKVAGLFLITGFRTIEGETVALLKEMNPANHDEFAPCDAILPLDAIYPTKTQVRWSYRGRQPIPRKSNWIPSYGRI